ncbi:hypothetical protein CPB86DRAFT_820339 [Serendipita vermifera]|nr:hypothetical protein CPB86DRAFT_820339 [Serendipita vermifera]
MTKTAKNKSGDAEQSGVGRGDPSASTIASRGRGPSSTNASRGVNTRSQVRGLIGLGRGAPSGRGTGDETAPGNAGPTPAENTRTEASDPTADQNTSEQPVNSGNTPETIESGNPHQFEDAPVDELTHDAIIVAPRSPFDSESENDAARRRPTLSRDGGSAAPPQRMSEGYEIDESLIRPPPRSSLFTRHSSDEEGRQEAGGGQASTAGRAPSGRPDGRPKRPPSPRHPIRPDYKKKLETLLAGVEEHHDHYECLVKQLEKDIEQYNANYKQLADNRGYVPDLPRSRSARGDDIDEEREERRITSRRGKRTNYDYRSSRYPSHQSNLEKHRRYASWDHEADDEDSDYEDVGPGHYCDRIIEGILKDAFVTRTQARQRTVNTPIGKLGVKLELPTEYNGSDDLMEFEQWLRKLITWLQLQRLDILDDEQNDIRMKILHLCLKSKAQKFFTTRCEVNYSNDLDYDFRDAVLDLKARFIAKNAALNARTKYENMTQGSRDVQTYFEELDEAAQ